MAICVGVAAWASDLTFHLMIFDLLLGWMPVKRVIELSDTTQDLPFKEMESHA